MPDDSVFKDHFAVCYKVGLKGGLEKRVVFGECVSLLWELEVGKGTEDEHVWRCFVSLQSALHQAAWPEPSRATRGRSQSPKPHIGHLHAVLTDLIAPLWGHC